VRYVISSVFLLALLISSVPLTGAPIPIFGTGLNASGLFLAPGVTDTHYTLTVNDLNTGPSTIVPAGANSVESTNEGIPQGWPFLPGVYADDTLAQWIAPQADIVGIQGTGLDSFFTYETTFDLTDFDLASVIITGHWTADNFLGQVKLNGNSIYSSSSCLSNGAYAFQELGAFTISSGFQAGINTLDFNVTNSGCQNTPPRTNPTGLLVDISGSGILGSGQIDMPEPGTVFPVAIGLVLAACTYRLRQRQKVRA